MSQVFLASFGHKLLGPLAIGVSKPIEDFFLAISVFLTLIASLL